MAVLRERKGQSSHQSETISARNGKTTDGSTTKHIDTSDIQHKHTLTKWQKVVLLDKEYTEKLSVCADSSARHGYLRPIMKALELSCHGILWFGLAIGGLLISHKPISVEILVNLLFALCFDVIIVSIIKLIFRRQRPATNKDDMFATPPVDKFSFPSGHATRAVLLFWFFTVSVSLSSVIMSWLIAAWSISVCLSRILLGRHHVIDVLCGILIGCAQYLAVAYLWFPRESCLYFMEGYFGEFHY